MIVSICATYGIIAYLYASNFAAVTLVERMVHVVSNEGHPGMVAIDYPFFFWPSSQPHLCKSFQIITWLPYQLHSLARTIVRPI
jgi:hypothetical protein